MDTQFAFDRCRDVQSEPNGRLDLWAREHYKSTIITFGLTIQDILNSPEETFGIFSHTRPIAKAFLSQIKRELEDNALLKDLFPDILWEDPRRQAPKWSEDGGLIVKREGNPKEATIEAHGLVDGQPTSRHFSKLVYDDVVTEASVTSPEMMNKTINALGLSYNLGKEGGARRFIGTRYHFNDAYGEVMRRGTAEPRLHPATIDGTVDGEPVLMSREALADKRRDQGSYIFACQMLQNPVADENQGFKREWVRHGGIESPPVTYILVDAASGKRKNNDWTSMWVVGLGYDQNYYAMDVIRDRLNLTQRAKTLMDLHRKWKPIEVRYERYGMMADIEHIKAEQERQGYRFDIVEVAGQTPKPDRIKRLVPLFEQGRIYLPQTRHYTNFEGRTTDLIDDFIEQELLAFPVSRHDDMLDSLARIAEPDLPLAWPEEVTIDLSTASGGGGSWMGA